MGNMTFARPLRSTGITLRPHYYGPRRLPGRAADGYGFPSPVELGLACRGLPGSMAGLSVPAAPNHPGGPNHRNCSHLMVRAGFTNSGRLAILRLRNEAESGSRFRIAADTFVPSGSAQQVAPLHAEFPTWITNFSHVQYLSTEKTNQASPGTPESQGRRGEDRDVPCVFAPPHLCASFSPLCRERPRHPVGTLSFQEMP